MPRSVISPGRISSAPAAWNRTNFTTFPSPLERATLPTFAVFRAPDNWASGFGVLLRSAHSDGPGGREIVQAQLHPLGALPAIDAQASGGVHALAAALDQRAPELLAGRTESDGRDDGAIARLEARAHVRPHLFGIDDGVRRQREYRLGIGGAKRAGARPPGRPVP